MSLFGSLFSKKKKESDYPKLKDFSSVVTDIHSHLIPGIDDGVKTMEESIDMIRKFSELGFKKIVTTPHVMSDFYKNTSENILEGVEQVRIALKQAGIHMQLDAAAEYYLDEGFISKLSKERMLTIGENYLLFEISYINPPDNIYTVIFDIIVKGYTPLLAHPERYDYWYEKFDEYVRLKEAGALFQININSLTGYYGIAAKRTAERLIDEKMVDFIGSDLLGNRHMQGLHHVLNEKYFHKLMAQGIKNPLL